MANEIKDIGEVVKKCKILLLDIEGTTTSISFVKDKLFPYAEENVKKFLDSQWETNDVKEAVAALRKLALEDQEKSVDGAVAIPADDASKDDQIEGIVKNVKWQMSSDRKAGALKQLQGLIWKQGYDNGEIKGHVYEDVSPALEQWRSVDGQKVYIYSSGSIQAQKLLFGQSLSGDLLKFIDGHFDTGVGPKQEAASYSAIVGEIGVKPEDILFLTDIPKEAEAARSAGLQVALVSREGNAPLPSEATDAFPVLHSLAQLTATNKRKTEPQDEQPAKVPKTDIVGDVKTTSDPAVSEPTASDEKQSVGEKEKEEKMEVEESAEIKETADSGNKVEKTANVETAVKEVTNSINPGDAPMVDDKPIITETGTGKPKEIEKMDTEVTESVEPKQDTKDTKAPDTTAEPAVILQVQQPEIATSNKTNNSEEKIDTKENGDKTSNSTAAEKIKPLEVTTETSKTKEHKEQKAEKTPPAVATEIEEITADSQCMGDVADMIEDLEPLVEEPNDDMEELQNVGEVLEKECDEILSKVQDVTNLDNIPLKPLLNTIVEETMDTELDAENMDSNDIVEGILDTELELEMKQSNAADLNIPAEITKDLKKDQAEKDKTTGTDMETDVKSEKAVEKNQENTKSASAELVTESTQDAMTAEQKTETKNAAETSAEVDNNSKVTSSDASACTVESSDKIENSNKVEGGAKVEDIDKNESSEKMETSDKVDSSDKMESSDAVEAKDKVEKNEVDEKKDNVETSDKVQNMAKEEIVEKKASGDKVETGEKPEQTDKIKPGDEPEEKKTEEAETKEKSDKLTANETKTKVESMDTETVVEATKSDSENDKESQVNGTATNGRAVNVNGDANNAEELKSRLSVENGKEPVNGSNGNSADAKQGQGDSKMEAEVSDIKVKTVATEEPPTDPIEQPTEA